MEESEGIMKYTLWYSCYVDSLKGYGVASSFVESNELIEIYSEFQHETTINQLSLKAVVNGLFAIPKGSSIDILGVNRYVDQCLKHLGSWVRSGEIEKKAHQDQLKAIWDCLIDMDKITGRYFLSRREHPMLWATSQASIDQFRMVQEKAIRELKFPEKVYFSPSQRAPREEFMNCCFRKPFTDVQFEKEIMKRKKQGLEEKPHDNVILFPDKKSLRIS